MTVTNIIEQIDSWGATEPNRIAYIAEKKYTYGQLKDWSDQLATFLSEKLIGRKPIVVYGDLEFEMLAAFLGASKAGHAYIPIEANTPNDRVELILKVAQPDLVISVEPWPEIATNCEVLNPEELKTVFKGKRTLPTFESVKGDENYYLILAQLEYQKACKLVTVTYYLL